MEICFEIHKLVSSLWNKEELHEQWKDQAFYLFVRKVMKQTVVITEACHCCQLHTNSYPTFICQVSRDTASLLCISLINYKNYSLPCTVQLNYHTVFIKSNIF